MPNTTNNTQNSTNALGEITALKSLLADSDYSILKTRAAANTPVSRTNGGDEPCGN